MREFHLISSRKSCGIHVHTSDDGVYGKYYVTGGYDKPQGGVATTRVTRYGHWYTFLNIIDRYEDPKGKPFSEEFLSII